MSNASNVKTITVDWLGEQRYVAQNPVGRQMIIDNSTLAVGVSPMEALLGALATCSAYDVVGILEKQRTPLKRYRLEVEGLRKDGTPAPYTRIVVRHLAAAEGLTAEALRKAAHLSHEKYCSVAASLNAEMVVETALLED